MTRPVPTPAGVRRPDACRLALVATLAVLAVLLVGGSVASAKSTTNVPKARAAYDRPQSVPGGCTKNRGYAVPAYSAEGNSYQTLIVRDDLEIMCQNTWDQLGDVSDALGVYKTTTNAWPANTIGSVLAAARTSLAELDDRLGSCSPSGTLAACEDRGATLASWARRNVEATDDATAAVNARLTTVADKLDTLHADLAAIRDGGGTDSAPITAAIDGSRDWLHADLWWMAGLGCALFFGSKLYRAVSPRA